MVQWAERLSIIVLDFAVVVHVTEKMGQNMPNQVSILIYIKERSRNWFRVFDKA